MNTSGDWGGLLEHPQLLSTFSLSSFPDFASFLLLYRSGSIKCHSSPFLTRFFQKSCFVLGELFFISYGQLCHTLMLEMPIMMLLRMFLQLRIIHKNKTQPDSDYNCSHNHLLVAHKISFKWHQQCHSFPFTALPCCSSLLQLTILLVKMSFICNWKTICPQSKLLTF